LRDSKPKYKQNAQEQMSGMRFTNIMEFRPTNALAVVLGSSTKTIPKSFIANDSYVGFLGI